MHPDGTPGDGTTEPGPDVVFYAEVPSPGRYRLFLDFKHDGVVQDRRVHRDRDRLRRSEAESPEAEESDDGHSDAH